MVKNVQCISRLLRERPHPELQNEPQIDSLDLPFPNPFIAMASESGLEQADHEINFGMEAPDYQEGAHLKGLNVGVLVAVIKWTGYFSTF